MESIDYLWKDRKRFLGMPLSFTRYRLSEDRLFCETGFLNVKSDEVLLYRVRDLRLTMSLGQRIFGVGTVCVVSSDKSIPHLDLKNVKDPRTVKELIHKNVEAAKDKRRMRATELLGGEDGPVCQEYGGGGGGPRAPVCGRAPPLAPALAQTVFGGGGPPPQWGGAPPP